MPTIEEIAQALKGGAPDSFALSTGMAPTPQPGQFPGQEKPLSAYEQLVKALHGVNEAIDPIPRTGSIPGDMAAAAPLAFPATRLPAKAALPLMTSAGLLGSMSSAGEAAEDPTGFPEPRPALDRQTEAKLNALNAQITAHRKTLAANEALKAVNPQLYARRTAEASAALPGLLEQASGIEGPHKTSMEGWQNRLNAYNLKRNEGMLGQQEQERAANTPFQVRNKWWNDTATPGALGAEGALGLIAGLTGKGKMLKPMLTGASVGGLSGALVSAAPNMIDAGTLPYGSQNQQGAWDQLTDPNFLKTKLLPEALLGAGTGALSAYVGSKGPVIAKTVADSAKSIAKWLKNPTGAKAPPRPRAAPIAPTAAAPAPLTLVPPVEAPVAVSKIKRTRAKKSE